MKTFSKLANNLDEQITLLQKRGLTILDPERAKHYLEVISFFRLSSYMRPFQIPSDKDHTFKPETEFKSVVNLYAFDRELRLLLMDAIERLEVAVRATFNNYMSIKYQTEQPYSGSHWYLNEMLFCKNYNHKRMLSDIENIQSKSKGDSYATFYKENYDAPRLMPSWAVVEELSFGAISHLYKGLAKDGDRKKIARRFDVPQDVFQSWLHSLNSVRNYCAHHSRLWNRQLSVSPKLPNALQWQLPEKLEPSQIQPNRRIYVVLLMLAHLMRQISPDSQWHNKVKALIVLHPEVPLAPMGFVENWRSHIFWGADQ